MSSRQAAAVLGISRRYLSKAREHAGRRIRDQQHSLWCPPPPHRSGRALIEQAWSIFDTNLLVRTAGWPCPSPCNGEAAHPARRSINAAIAYY